MDRFIVETKHKIEETTTTAITAAIILFTFQQQINGKTQFTALQHFEVIKIAVADIPLVLIICIVCFYSPQKPLQRRRTQTSSILIIIEMTNRLESNMCTFVE